MKNLSSRFEKFLYKDTVLTTRPNILIVLFLGYFLSACSIQAPSIAVPEHQIPLPETISKTGTYYWWYARFKMVWSKDIATLDFGNDLIIAHQIINPVLERHHQDIKLWRFHRRAANDSAGQQFSFIFYTTPDNARKIFQQIKENPISQQLVIERIVEKLRLDNPDKPKRPNIEDTSDKNWSVTVQKSWPYYIMGVSILWLDLLNQQAVLEQIDHSQDLPSQLEQYKQIQEQLTQQWQTQGDHAFFHHISGIFAYEPLEVHF